jgi:uncharacterized membrane protein YkgB
MRDFDTRPTHWMAKHGLGILRISLGIIFLWFGVLKFVPGLSPADELAGRTIQTLSLGLVTPDVSRPILAVWETLIGLGLIFAPRADTGDVRWVWLRATLLLLGLQMAGTFTPLALFPGQTWSRFPIAPTLEGQYIIKNLVLIAAATVVGGTVRGVAIVASPRVAAKAQVEDEAEAKGRESAGSPGREF